MDKQFGDKPPSGMSFACGGRTQLPSPHASWLILGKFCVFQIPSSHAAACRSFSRSAVPPWWHIQTSHCHTNTKIHVRCPRSVWPKASAHFVGTVLNQPQSCNCAFVVQRCSYTIKLLHPSPLVSHSGLEGVGTFPKSRTEEGFHWGKVSVYHSTNIERPATICTPTDKCLDCGVKLEYPKRTQADTELAYTKGHNSTQTVATIGYSCAVQRSRAFWKKKNTSQHPELNFTWPFLESQPWVLPTAAISGCSHSADTTHSSCFWLVHVLYMP